MLNYFYANETVKDSSCRRRPSSICRSSSSSSSSSRSSCRRSSHSRVSELTMFYILSFHLFYLVNTLAVVFTKKLNCKDKAQFPVLDKLQ